MSRSFGGTRFTTFPPIAISPPPICSSPAIIRRSVDLPQPDGPTSTQNSPSAMSTSTPRITCVDPKCLWTARIATAATSFPPPRVLRLSRAGPDDVRRPAGREPGYDVLRCLSPKLLFRFDRVERRVRRKDNARMAEELRSRGHGLVGQHVESQSREPPGVERGKRGIDVDHGAPRGVHEVGAGLRGRESVCADHPPRLRVERHVQRDYVAVGEQPRLVAACNIRGKVAVDQVRVAGENAREYVAA